MLVAVDAPSAHRTPPLMTTYPAKCDDGMALRVTGAPQADATKAILSVPPTPPPVGQGHSMRVSDPLTRLSLTRD